MASERLRRRRVEELEIANPEAPGALVTASVGVAVVCPLEGGSIEDLIHSADTALYHAKRSGRNRVHSA